MYQNPNNQTQNPGILPGKVVCFNWKILNLLSLFFLAVLSPDEEQLHFDTFFEVGIGIIIWSLLWCRDICIRIKQQLLLFGVYIKCVNYFMSSYSNCCDFVVNLL